MYPNHLIRLNKARFPALRKQCKKCKVLRKHYTHNAQFYARFTQAMQCPKYASNLTQAISRDKFQPCYWRIHHRTTGLQNPGSPSSNCHRLGLPAWFMRLGAAIFSKPLTRLFNISLSTSVVSRQWKCACIRMIPKTNPPKQHADFRPISVTPVFY